MLLAGVLLAWYGGTLFVEGSAALAKWARWPAAVIGVTVAAFGTSAPELMVAIQASIEGVPQISLGDVLGSNVVNISLILGLVLSLSGMRTQDETIPRDWASALAVPVIMGLVLWDGWFSRLDGIILLSVFCGWLFLVVRHARSHAARQLDLIPVTATVPVKSLLRVPLGLIILIAAAQLVVHGGKGVAVALGWANFIVGAIIVAVATGTPELATTLVARFRGHHDVGLANILGSNVFNALFIAALAAIIHPYPVKWPMILPSLIFGLATTLLIRPSKDGCLRRWRGFILLAVYAGYLAYNLEVAEA